MGVVNQAIEDGIGNGRIGDDLVPVLDRQLAGDDGGAAIVSVIDDLRVRVLYAPRSRSLSARNE
jgi:hypothetical protein